MRVKTIRKGFYDKPPYNKPIDIKGGFFYNKKGAVQRVYI
jgi:hypothetical protein